MQNARLKNNVDSSRLSEAIKSIQLPTVRAVDGVDLIATPVAVLDPSNPIGIAKNVPWGRGILNWYKNETADSSNKTILTVPLGHTYEIVSLLAKLVSSAVVGNRTLQVEILDYAPATIAKFDVGATQAASLTYTYQYGHGMQLDATAPALSMGLPILRLPAGYSIKVYDSAAVDAAADDLSIYVQYIDYGD